MSTSDENIVLVKKMILDNHGINIREVADNVGISFGLCRAIFMDFLGMKGAAAKIAPNAKQFSSAFRFTLRNNGSKVFVLSFV